MPLVEARSLVKRFGNVVAVAGISFTVRAGECFGLLGPNGSGKTSTMRLIGCVSPVTSGELRVAGMDVRERPREIRRLIGVVPQEDNLDRDLTVLQNLQVYARYFNLPAGLAHERALAWLQFFQLTERAKSPVDDLSGGMKRRLLIARALMHEPKLLILDEPTTGLDPQARRLVWEQALELKARGITVLLSSHYMDEAAYLCDRLLILDMGRVVEEGSPAELVRRHVSGEVLELRPAPSEREALLTKLEALGVEHQASGPVLFAYPKDGRTLARELEGAVAQLTYRTANLEDVFLRLTGRELREG